MTGVSDEKQNSKADMFRMGKTSAVRVLHSSAPASTWRSAVGELNYVSYRNHKREVRVFNHLERMRGNVRMSPRSKSSVAITHTLAGSLAGFTWARKCRVSTRTRVLERQRDNSGTRTRNQVNDCGPSPHTLQSACHVRWPFQTLIFEDSFADAS
jgi:hypothetical protein